ncbi:hypothetical protein ATZ33_17315 [Enterococcus silesiacus]|uniref:Uncharacterized protein n=1 Tax=Enterococcus silesiacus TaxID=332949 RepID=A0ABN4JC99_9ENTE|nr:hypothetical protein [Enterococcus silesiacus]ALS03073.1 hypothetical protein ATZ33_17315 [Enterococcus silesiacus]
MLNPEQNKLVVQAIKDKRDNYAALINHENTKPLKDQDFKKTDQLTEMYHKFMLILDKVQRVGM